MARICETTIVLILSLVLSTYSALAKRVSISGTHSFSDIYGSCSAAGGEYYQSGIRYGCVNKKKGTRVDCKGGTCTGTVPN
jgi:hypothetical protein